MCKRQQRAALIFAKLRMLALSHNAHQHRPAGNTVSGLLCTVFTGIKLHTQFSCGFKNHLIPILPRSAYNRKAAGRARYLFTANGKHRVPAPGRNTHSQFKFAFSMHRKAHFVAVWKCRMLLQLKIPAVNTESYFRGRKHIHLHSPVAEKIKEALYLSYKASALYLAAGIVSQCRILHSVHVIEIPDASVLTLAGAGQIINALLHSQRIFFIIWICTEQPLSKLRKKYARTGFKYAVGNI